MGYKKMCDFDQLHLLEPLMYKGLCDISICHVIQMDLYISVY